VHPGFGDIKLVALSFHPDDAQVRSAQAAGFHYHFPKPMTKVQLRRLKKLMGSLSGQVQLEDTTDDWV
jgi:hypothetical protein